MSAANMHAAMRHFGAHLMSMSTGASASSSLLINEVKVTNVAGPSTLHMRTGNSSA